MIKNCSYLKSHFTKLQQKKQYRYLTHKSVDIRFIIYNFYALHIFLRYAVHKK